MSKKFKIYPSIGIARLGDSKPQKDDVVFSPEIPWANLYETENNYITPDGKLKKQAQKFYIYECDEKGNPTGPADLSGYDVEWTVEVANKKAFWYDFNNSLDLSVQLENHNNLSPNFYDNAIAPGIDASYRNPNVLNQKERQKHGVNFRKELVNSPGPVTVKDEDGKQKLPINGTFPYAPNGDSKVAAVLNAKAQPVNLGTLEYDNGDLIFYGADGLSAALNPSDLNTDFADNSNWYDDICDGRVTAKLTPKGGGTPIDLADAESAAWIASAPPDYAPQIQPISTMFDLIMGAAEDHGPEHEHEHKENTTTDFSMVFPLMYRLYRMQWVNLGDFLSPSFKETIDQLIHSGGFKYLYQNDSGSEAYNVRNSIFMMFRNPHYDYTNEPIIPSKEKTDLINLGSGNEDLKLPFYPGDGINYPGSPAQWFAIPPLLYKHLEMWRDGHFAGLDGTYENMDKIGEHYQHQFIIAAKDPAKRGLLMTRAVLETLYGGGFHPGVELTWPLRHKQLYKENSLPYEKVTEDANLYGLREVRVNAATPERQKEIFYNDFGLQINANDIKESLEEGNYKNWFWEMTPGDFTKWMGIPWQSDAGSCQAVFTDSQYPVPAWWAANLPVDVLTEESLVKIQDKSILDDTKLNIYANRLPWLQTTDTGFVGYHAEGGYMNGLIAMVYQWKKIGVVTGRKSHSGLPGIPETVYVSFDTKNNKTKSSVFLGKSISARPAAPNPPSEFYTNTRETIWIPEGKDLILSSRPDGTGDVSVDDLVKLSINGEEVFSHDFSNGCSGRVTPHEPFNLNSQLEAYRGNFVTITISYWDKCGGSEHASNFYLAFK